MAPPSIYSPRDPVNTEACRGTSFSLRTMTAASSRDIVKCLNGDNDAMKPIKDFLDEAPTEDLDALFSTTNKYFGDVPNRANQVLDLVERMNRTGLARELYKNLDALTATDLLQSLPPLVSTIMEDPNANRAGKLDPDLLASLPALRNAARDGTLSGNLIFGARAFNSTQAMSLAWLLGREFPGTPLNSDQYVERLMPFLGGSSQGDFTGLMWGLSDPALIRAFQGLTPVEASDLANLMQEIPLGSVAGTSNTLSNLKSVVLTTDRPVRCFNNGKVEQTIPNTFEMFVSEMISRKSNPDLLSRFLLMEAPVLISATVANCDLDPSVSTHFPVFMRLSQKGLAPGLAASVGLFRNPDRLEYLKIASKNPLMDKTGALLENIAYRKGFSQLTELARTQLRVEEFKSLARLSNHLMYPLWSAAQVTNWVKTKTDSPHREALLKVLSSLPDDRKTLVNLIEFADGQVSDLAMKHLRLRLRDTVLSQGSAVALENLVRKLATRPQAQEDIKRVAKALVQNWSIAGTGLGYILGISAESVDLATEEPIMAFLGDLLADRPLIEATGPSFIRLLRHPKLVPALRHVGTLAANGDLGRIVDFLSEVSRNKLEPGLQTPERPRRYLVNKTVPVNPNDAGANYQQPIPPAGDYSACFTLSGDLLAPGGNNLYQAMKCLDARGGAAAFQEMADILKSSGVLAPFTELATKRLVNKMYIHDVLRDLTALRTSGDLRRIFDLLKISMEPSYDLVSNLDPLLGAGLKSLRVDQALDGVGDILAVPNSQKGAQEAIDLIADKTDKRVLRSIPNYSYPIQSPQALQAAARRLFPDWSPAQLDREFNLSLFDFQTRPESFYTGGNTNGVGRPGIYPDFSDKDLTSYVDRAASDLLRDNALPGAKRTTDLKELLKSFKEIYESDNGKTLEGFLRWGISNPKPVVYYHQRDDNPILRIATPFDQMDMLMLNSDVSILKWVPFGVGVDHVGTFFAIELANATDLTEALKKMKKKLDDGTTFSFLMPAREKVALKNMIQHFEILESANRAGYLRVIQRLYQGFMAATPEKYRDKQDKNFNHVWWLSGTAPYGLLGRSVPALASAQQQGQLSNLVRGLFGPIKMLNLADTREVEKLHRLVTMLTRPGVAGRSSSLGFTVSKVLEVSRNPNDFPIFKENLFHLAASLPKLSDRATGVIEAVLLLDGDPELTEDAIAWAFRDLGKPYTEGLSGRFGANLLAMEDTTNLRRISDVLMRPPANYPETHAAAYADLLVTMARLDRPTLDRLVDGLDRYTNDSRVQNIDLYRTFKNLIGYTGLVDLFKATLKDPQDRRTIQQTLNQIAQAKAFSKLFQNAVQANDAGDIERFILFLETYLVRTDIK